MKRSDAFPGNFLKQSDFPQPTKAKVQKINFEKVGDDEKAVMYLVDPSDPQLDTSKGYVMNHTSWTVMEEIAGSDDSDDWIGKQVVFYVDPNVMYGSKKVGGIRLRPAGSTPPDADLPF